jgi:ATP-binding cassette subfamily B protein
MLVVPLFAQPAIVERDLRMRGHAGALARFYLDALLGLVVIRAHNAEDAIARKHGERLNEWVGAARAALRAAFAAETVQVTLGFGLSATLLVKFVSSGDAAGDPGALLLVVYWSLTLPALGLEIVSLVQRYPAERNVLLRLAEPLGAPEDEAAIAIEGSAGREPPFTPGEVPIVDGSDGPRTTLAEPGLHIELCDVVVQAGGQDILSVDTLSITPGEHVAIVGPSGAGKSSLVGLLLGWHRATGSVETVRVNDEPLVGDALDRARRTTVWIDPTVYLWNRSLHENLSYGLGAAPPSVEAAIAEADLAEVVSRLPRGTDSRLGEAGGLLSAGEGQRVRFGRGIGRPRPRLVILDEPFRGLTRDRRRALLARARQRWASATLLCVTHDIEETRAFPRVVVVVGGRVVEDGAPNDLRERADSYYASLLVAERRVRRAVWSPEGDIKWRRHFMRDGRLVSLPERNVDADPESPTVVDAERRRE